MTKLKALQGRRSGGSVCEKSLDRSIQRQLRLLDRMVGKLLKIQTAYRRWVDDDDSSDSDLLAVLQTVFPRKNAEFVCVVQNPGRELNQALLELLRTRLQRAERSESLVAQLAALKMWDFDRDDGTPYRECDEPSGAYQDSHVCLMSLIEAARALSAAEHRPR